MCLKDVWLDNTQFFLMWPNDVCVCVCCFDRYDAIKNMYIVYMDIWISKAWKKSLCVFNQYTHISLILIHTSPCAHNSKEYLLLNNRITTVHIIYCSASHSWKFRWKHKKICIEWCFVAIFFFVLFGKYCVVLCICVLIRKVWRVNSVNHFARNFNRFYRCRYIFFLYVYLYTKHRVFLSPPIIEWIMAFFSRRNLWINAWHRNNFII